MVQLRRLLLIAVSWILWAQGTASAAKPLTLPPEVDKALRTNPLVTLYSLQPFSEPNLPEWDFHRNHVLGKVNLDAEKSKIAIAALQNAVTNGAAGVYAACIIKPRHAFRFQVGENTYDILICYECGQLQMLRNSGEFDPSLQLLGSIGGTPQVLNDLLLEAGIILADTPAVQERSYAEHAKVALKRAEEGDAWAQNVIARLLFRGWGVKQNIAEGSRWLAKSMSLSTDDPVLQVKLGRMFLRGEDVPESKETAFQLFRSAADQGSAEGLYQMGRAQEYYFGGVSQADYVEVTKWFLRAAEAGSMKAEVALGFIYLQGEKRVPKDPQEALKWLRQAAEHGHPDAFSGLSRMYDGTSGFARSPVDMYVWDQLDAEYEIRTYTKRKPVAVKLTPKQRTLANQRIAEWLATHPNRFDEGDFR